MFSGFCKSGIFTFSRIKTGLWLIAFLVITKPVSAQLLSGAGARWSDSFREWVLYTDVDGEEGDLHLRWQNTGDWTEWEYQLAGISGAIKVKWPDNPGEWEIRNSEGEIVTAKTLWNNNFREWRISDNNIQLTLVCRYNSTWDEWEVQGNHGQMEIYTAFTGDPRDWVVVDELDEEVPTAIRMGILFIVLFHSSPKY